MQNVHPYDVYQSFIAIKLHFTTQAYDCLKYGYATKRSTPESYLKRKDKKFFALIGRKFSTIKEIREFFIANFVYSNNEYIMDFVDQGPFDIYLKKFLKIKESFRYIFSSDMMTLRDIIIINKLKSVSELFFQIEPKTTFPYIINAVKQNKITIESFLVVENLLTFLEKTDRIIKDSSNHNILIEKIWKNQYLKFRKYSGLVLPLFVYDNGLNIDKDIKPIIMDNLFFKNRNRGN